MSRAGHGMFAPEARIMELWDAGRTIPQIVDETGSMRSTVEVTVNMYRFRESAFAWEDAARRASEQLARACAATGQSFA